MNRLILFYSGDHCYAVRLWMLAALPVIGLGIVGGIAFLVWHFMEKG